MKDDVKLIDCFGDVCPVPIIKIEQEIKESKAGHKFMVVVDHSCTIEAIKNKYLDKKHDVKIDEVMNGVWEVTFTVK